MKFGWRRAKVFHPYAGAGREDDLAIFAPERREAVPVERGIGVEQRPKRDVHDHRVPHRSHGNATFSGRGAMDGPTNWNRSSKVSSRGWNWREV